MSFVAAAPILSKLGADSLLSLYPVFVKKIDLPLTVQIWSRFATYAIISAAFVNWSVIRAAAFSRAGVAISLVTMAHIYTSYRGFLLLESGVAYTLFYLYPIFILLGGAPSRIWSPIWLVALMGVYLLTAGGGDAAAATSAVSWEGVAMVLLAALTEAAIFFLVRQIKTENPWNHLFLSYVGGAVLASVAFYPQIRAAAAARVGSSVAINGAIGLFGYLLQFFAAYRLPAAVFAPMSYFGVFMSFIYGATLGGDAITAQKVWGAMFVVCASVYSTMMV